MKASLILSLLILTIFSSLAHAEQKLVTCNRVQPEPSPNHILNYIILVVADNDVINIRTRLYNYRMRNLTSTKLPDQNIPDYTLYDVQGIKATMEVPNEVLAGNSGLVRLGTYEFSCL